MTTKRDFFKGAIVLMIANIIVKLIGAFYTVPLARMIGPEGMGIYNSAYQIYMWLFIISTTGFPIAISKMVSENIALGRTGQAHQVFKVSLMLLSVLGFISSIVLFCFSGYITGIIGSSKAYLSLISIAPSLFFISIMSTFRGYFQGLQNMSPTAISQLVEAVTKAIVGLFIADLLLNRGIEFASSGALIGVTIGSFLGMVYLVFEYIFIRYKNKKKIKCGKKIYSKHGTREIISSLIRIALPITIGASVFSISNIIDLAMIMRRLKEIGFNEEYSTILYGYLSGYAHKIIMLPSTVIIALSISIIPVLAAAFAKKNAKQIEKIVGFSLKSSILFSIPSSVGICILSKEILNLLFKDCNAVSMLQILSISIIFITMVQVSSSILQGIGKSMIPVKNLFLAAILKIILNYILVGIPQINILGAAISTNISYLLVAVLNIIQIKKIMKYKIDFIDLFIKPVFASIIMGYTIIKILSYTKDNSCSNIISVAICVITGSFIYLVTIIIIKGITKNDLENIPYGDKMTHYLCKYGIIK